MEHEGIPLTNLKTDFARKIPGIDYDSWQTIAVRLTDTSKYGPEEQPGFYNNCCLILEKIPDGYYFALLSPHTPQINQYEFEDKGTEILRDIRKRERQLIESEGFLSVRSDNGQDGQVSLIPATPLISALSPSDPRTRILNAHKPEIVTANAEQLLSVMNLLGSCEISAVQKIRPGKLMGFANGAKPSNNGHLR